MRSQSATGLSGDFGHGWAFVRRGESTCDLSDTRGYRRTVSSKICAGLAKQSSLFRMRHLSGFRRLRVVFSSCLLRESSSMQGIFSCIPARRAGSRPCMCSCSSSGVCSSSRSVSLQSMSVVFSRKRSSGLEPSFATSGTTIDAKESVHYTLCLYADCTKVQWLASLAYRSVVHFSSCVFWFAECVVPHARTRLFLRVSALACRAVAFFGARFRTVPLCGGALWRLSCLWQSPRHVLFAPADAQSVYGTVDCCTTEYRVRTYCRLRRLGHLRAAGDRPFQSMVACPRICDHCERVLLHAHDRGAPDVPHAPADGLVFVVALCARRGRQKNHCMESRSEEHTS